MESGGRGGERRLALDDLENVERLDGRELARIVEKNLAAVHDDEMRESGFLEESKGRERSLPCVGSLLSSRPLWRRYRISPFSTVKHAP